MFGGTRFLFDISAKGGYLKIFGDPVSKLTDDEFKLLAGTYFLCDEVRSLWKIKRELDNAENKNSPGLARRWIVYYAVGQLLRLMYSDNADELNQALRKLAKPNNWMDDPKNAAKIAIGEVFGLTTIAVSKAYNSAAKQADFRHRNWFRSLSTLADINAELEIIPQYRSKKDLPWLTAAGPP